MRASWKGVVIAESDDTVVVEGNHYFPRDAVRDENLRPSRHWSICPWKGVASYHSLSVDGEVNADAAWEYRHPSPLAHRIKRRVAFGDGVDVDDSASDQR